MTQLIIHTRDTRTHTLTHACRVYNVEFGKINIICHRDAGVNRHTLYTLSTPSSSNRKGSLIKNKLKQI